MYQEGKLEPTDYVKGATFGPKRTDIVAGECNIIKYLLWVPRLSLFATYLSLWLSLFVLIVYP